MHAQRYTAVAIVLHWAIALAIFGMIALGWWMGDALEDSATQAQAIAAFQLHKSIGLSVLVLSLARLGWRLINPPPPLPAGMKAWERAGRHGHALGVLCCHRRHAADRLALCIDRLVHAR